MTDKTATRMIAVVLAVMTIGGIAFSGAAVAQETAGNDEDVDAQQSSHLRVIHAASGAPAVDVSIDGEEVATGVEAGDASEYLELAAGNHSVEVTAAEDADAATNETDGETDSALFEGTVYLEPRTSSTLALTAEDTQMGGVDEGAAETPADAEDNETDLGADNETENGAAEGPAADDNETDLGADDNTTEDNETDLGADTETEDNETDLGTDTETENNETDLGADTETEDNETDLGADTETENNETDLGADNETENGAAEAPAADDNETDAGADDDATDGGAAEAPTDDGEVTSLSPVLFVDNAWEPGDDSAALSIVHLAQGADAVDVTVAGNETDVGADDNETDAGADDNETDGGAAEAPTGEDNATVLAENLEFQSASDYVTVPAGDHTLEIRQAAENNDGEVIQTVNVSVEGGNAYSALVLAGNASDQMTDGTNETDGAAEAPTDDNETDLGADDNTTEDNETDGLAGADNATEDDETDLGADNETDAGANETDEMMDNETTATETDDATDDATDGGAAEAPTDDAAALNVTTVEDVTYSVTLPGEDTTDDGTNGADDETDDAADDETDDGEDDASLVAPPV